MQLRLRSESEEVDFTKGDGLFALPVRSILFLILLHNSMVRVFSRDKRVIAARAMQPLSSHSLFSAV